VQGRLLRRGLPSSTCPLPLFAVIVLAGRSDGQGKCGGGCCLLGAAFVQSPEGSWEGESGRGNGDTGWTVQ
jgi:hypothetical protein